MGGGPVINIGPLDAAISYAAAHPAEFYMQAWFKQTDCGTTACLAGTIAVQDGWTPADWTTRRATGETPNGESRASRVTKDGATKSVSGVAAHVLGLHEYGDLTLLLELFHAPNLAAVIRVRNRKALEQGLPERVWSVPR